MENFSLLLHKSKECITYDGNHVNITKLNVNDKVSNNKLKQKKVVLSRKDRIEGFLFDNIQFDQLHFRQRKLVASHCSRMYEFIATPDYRLISGLGNASIYETSISLHHVYGFPYLPATSVKGIVRDYYLHTYIEPHANDNDIEEYAFKNNRTFCHLFGAKPNNCVSNDNAMIGDLVFFDSLPINSPRISIDVMTVHYKKYYGEENLPPADWQEPNPIPFMTLKKEPNHNHFAFFIGLRKGVKDNLMTEYGLTLFEFAKKLLEEALMNHGIGAKTAVGYGYMEPVKK